MALAQRAHLDVVKRFLDGKRRVIVVYDVVIVVMGIGIVIIIEIVIVR